MISSFVNKGLTEEDHVREVILVSGREKEEVAPEVDQEDPGLEIDYEDPDQEKGSVRDLVKEEDQGLGKEEGQGQGTGEGLRDLDQEIGSKGQRQDIFFYHTFKLRSLSYTMGKKSL